MFSSFLCASLIALIASATSVSAARSLTLKTSTPDVNVSGLENLKVTATITNTGDVTLKLLNDPRGVLNTFPENSFNIANPVGSRPSFHGAKIKYLPAYAAGLNDPSEFTILDPGASIDVTHDLSAVYNFTRSGAGAYSIEPSTLFTYVDADGTPKDFHATVEDVAKVKLSGNLAVSRVRDKRATLTSCEWLEQVLLTNAIDSAQTYAEETYNYTRGMSRDSSRYRTWFGTYTPIGRIIVESHFKEISSHQFSSFTYDCSCSNPSSAAYVFADEFGEIHLCGGFWDLPNTGSDSRAGTLIHEASHFNENGSTLDHVYGVDKAKELAKTSPSKATDNADNHQFFAENDPALS